MTPSLWSKICLLWAPQAVDTFAARSGAALLSLTLPATSPELKDEFTEFLVHQTKIVTTNMHRIRALDLHFFHSLGRESTDVSVPYQTLFDSIIGHPAKQLKTFRLIISHDTFPHQSSIVNLFNLDAPLLETIHLERCSSYQNFDPSAFPSLISLTIHAQARNSLSNLSQVTRILSNARQLVHFTFEGLGAAFDEYRDPQPSPTVVLPHCITISLRDCFTDQITYFLSVLSVSSLQSLTIDGIQRREWVNGSETQLNPLSYLPVPFRVAFVDVPYLAINLQNIQISLEIKSSTRYHLYYREKSLQSHLQGWEGFWATRMLSAASENLVINPTQLEILVTHCDLECLLLPIISKKTWMDVLLRLPALTCLNFDSDSPIPFSALSRLALALTDRRRICPALVTLKMECPFSPRDEPAIQKMFQERIPVTLINRGLSALMSQD